MAATSRVMAMSEIRTASMRNSSPGGRILAILEWLLPDGSPSALYIGDLLKEGPAIDRDEQKSV